MEKNITDNTNSTTLVTAIYGYGHTSVYGGRGRGIYFYNSVLRSIALLKLPIVIYAPKEDIETIEGYVKSYLTDYKIIPYELDQFIYFKEVYEHKKEILHTIEFNDRNHILCYNKLFWVNDAADKNYFNTEKFAWIDCGLFHHGIIPEKVGGVELSPNILPGVYWPDHTDSIFNLTLGSKLDKNFKKGKIFSCAHPIIGDSAVLRTLIKETYSIDVYTPYHIVGGMFGGYRDDIKIFLEDFNKVLKYNVDHKLLLLEEPLFSCIAAVKPDMFDIHHFGNWWYYSPGERCSYLTEEGDSFYKIFTRIYES